MKRIKRLGLLLAAALCLATAVSVPAASGSAFVANNDPWFAEYTGTSTGKGLRMEYGGHVNWCTLTFSGEMERATESLDPSSTNLSSCSFPTNLNGCEFVFSGGAAGEPGQFGGSAKLGPPGCGPITVNHGFYVASIYPSSISVSYTNYTSSTITGWMSGGASYLIPKPWGSGKLQETGSIESGLEITAKRLGASVPFSMQAELPVGVGIEGGASAQFAAESYPVNIRTATGWSPEAIWTLKTTSQFLAKCKGVQYSAAMSSASKSLTVQPTYSGCIVGGLYGAVRMNGCSYVLTLSSETSGTTGITCPEGKVIEVLAFLDKAAEEKNNYLCKAEIGPQTGALETSNWYAGFLGLTSSIANLKFTWTRKSAACLGSSGAYEGGDYKHEMRLAGSR